MSEGKNGNTFYVDFERIRKHDGFVYWWYWTDFLKPISGILSAKTYQQDDCKLFRFKYLSFVHHKQPMGTDTGGSNSPKNPEWTYPSPNSSMETILKSVCSRLVNKRRKSAIFFDSLLFARYYNESFPNN